MKDKYEFDETEMIKIPDKTTIMELGLSWNSYGGWVHCIFSILLFSGVGCVINYALVELYKVNLFFSTNISLFIGGFFWALWRRKISNAEILCFFFLSVLGGSGEVEAMLLLKGNFGIINYLFCCVLSIITSVKLGLSLVNKKEREVFRSKLMVTIFSLFFYNVWITIIVLSVNEIIYRVILCYLIYIFIGFFLTYSLKKIVNICLFTIFIFSSDMIVILKTAFIDFNIISWELILIILSLLYTGTFIAFIVIKLKNKSGDL